MKTKYINLRKEMLHWKMEVCANTFRSHRMELLNEVV